MTEENYKEFGKFDELVGSVDREKAAKFFAAVEQAEYRPFKLGMYIHNYLKSFILSGGIDPYTDFLDEDRWSQSNHEAVE